jgi:hypothetical protein
VRLVWTVVAACRNGGKRMASKGEDYFMGQ